MTWNHNTHYHPFLLAQVPDPCGRALDVGCGTGTFARLLAARAGEVDAVDVSGEMVAATRDRGVPNIRAVRADITDPAFELRGYDFISAVASLHHVPFAPTLARLRDALHPGGVLAVLGLYRHRHLSDLATDVAAIPANRVRLLVEHRRDPTPPDDVPVRDPALTLPQIRRHLAAQLPGARVRRHLYWRYSAVYRAAPE